MLKKRKVSDMRRKMKEETEGCAKAEDIRKNNLMGVKDGLRGSKRGYRESV